MLREKIIKIIQNDQYFNIIRITLDYIEIQSFNTQHCWIIRKLICQNAARYKLYHKHSIYKEYYHLQAENYYKINDIIEDIKKHDSWIISQSQNKEGVKKDLRS